MSNIFPKIYPYLDDEKEMKKLGRQTEYGVYKKLLNIFDDSVEVLCDPKFIRRNKFGDLRDGEYSDFIILHPKKGIIFLECKGGIITFSPETKKWSQNGVHLKIDPISQATFGKYKLLKTLEKVTKVTGIPTVCGAIFPNTPKPKGFTGQDIKPEMLIWAEQYEDLEGSINKMFYLNQSEFELGKNEKKYIRQFVYGDELESPFKKILKLGEHQQDLEFDRDQQSFLLSVFKNKKMIIEGLAGTGKTIIAAKIATHEEYNNKKVLMLTKTKGLSQFLKILTRKPENTNKDFRVFSIDQFVRKTADRLRYAIQPLNRHSSEEEKRTYFDEYSPTRCKSMFEKFPEEKIDLLIVDEAQDFHKNWFASLNSIVKEDGKIFFFYDPLQTTIDNSMTEILREPEKINFPLFNFNANYRNSSSISHFLSKLILKYFPEVKLTYSKHSDAHMGRKIELVEADSFDEIIIKTIEKVKSLIEVDKFKARDIAVLGVDNMRPSLNESDLSMTKGLTSLGLKVIQAYDYSLPYLDPNEQNCITFSDVRSFKGLEKRSVILVNFKEVNKENIKRIYTGLSRARGDLTIITYKNAIDEIKSISK